MWRACQTSAEQPFQRLLSGRGPSPEQTKLREPVRRRGDACIVLAERARRRPAGVDAPTRGSRKPSRPSCWYKAIARWIEPHLTFFEDCAWSSKRLGLGSGDPGFDQPPPSLNLIHMRRVLPDFDGVLESLGTTLERERLIPRSRRAALASRHSGV